MNGFFSSKQLLILVFFVVCCSNLFGQSQQNFSIKGNIENGKDQMIYLIASHDFRVIQSLQMVIDSCILQDGKFNFEGEIDEPTRCAIRLKNEKGWKPFILENITYVANGKADSIWQLDIMGGLEINAQKELSESKRELITLLNKSSDNAGVANRNGDTLQRKEFLRLNKVYSDSIRKTEMDFVKNNPDLYTSLFLLSDKITNVDKVTAISISGGLSSRLKNHSEYTKILLKIESKEINVGERVRNLEYVNINNDTIELYQTLDDLTLIDFWASWCGPCRKKYPKTKALYDKYKSKNFSITSISLDKIEKDWKAAIKEDRSPWVQLIDLQNSNHKVKELYGLDFIPYNFLVNKEGEILAIDIKLDELERTYLYNR